MLYAVIMAGGSGTRFWPESTEGKPKQFLALFGEKTMLQTTVERIKPLIPLERILIVTNERYADLTAEQLPELPKDNIIGEPVGKNTAPCVASAAALINQKDEDATMAVLPADHLIKNDESFHSTLKKAAEKAQTGALITIGIQPRHAETGYGYIEVEKNEERPDSKARKVAKFREKPDEATAREFVEVGNYYWNSGMFIWKVSAIRQEYKKHLPEIYEQIEMLEMAGGSNSQQGAINVFYKACPSISVDYGIMEKAENVFVIPAEFDWNDVGDWMAYYELSEKDRDGNAIHTKFSVTESAYNNLIHSQNGKIIALSGVDNIAVVETDNAILICDLNNAQNVKQVVNQIREKEDFKEFFD